MQAYRTSLTGTSTNLVMSPNTPFFRYFNDPILQGVSGEGGEQQPTSPQGATLGGQVNRLCPNCRRSCRNRTWAVRRSSGRIDARLRVVFDDAVACTTGGGVGVRASELGCPGRRSCRTSRPPLPSCLSWRVPCGPSSWRHETCGGDGSELAGRPATAHRPDRGSVGRGGCVAAAWLMAGDGTCACVDLAHAQAV